MDGRKDLMRVDHELIFAVVADALHTLHVEQQVLVGQQVDGPSDAQTFLLDILGVAAASNGEERRAQWLHMVRKG